MAVGIDVGGTGVRAARASAGGIASEPIRLQVDAALARDELLERISAALEAAGGAESGPVVVAIPSFVSEQGLVVDCPALPALTGVALAAELGGSVTVVPDLAAAAVGESKLGSGRGVRRFVCVALGTGANAAAVVDGALVETAFGCLGDAGHVLVDPDGPVCACGGRGCLEAIASGGALARDGAPLGLPDARAVVEAARAGRPDASALVERAGVALGRALATWSALLWPDRAAVAGGVARAGELLLAPARRELVRVGTPYIVGRLEVVPAVLGADATLAGACLLAARVNARPG